MTLSPATSLRRRQDATARTTNIELFFDLVFVFAVTQLSHRLLAHPTVGGALQTLVLFAMVWLLWAYTTWVTNWLDPERLPVRVLLLALMVASLVLSAGLPDAFAQRGVAVGVTYAVMQIGRTVFTVVALRGERLQANFERILAWCVLSGALAIAGGLAHGTTRELLWVATVIVDVVGGLVGFYTPGLGRSYTSDWDIDGNHIAERCQAFLLIALGESVVVIGSTLAASHTGRSEVVAFVAAFVGAAALWWVYFDRSADAAAELVAASDDPGRLGRNAYHLVHPIMVAGIIATAAADEKILAHPRGHADAALALMMLGGGALFLLGHAAFKALVWRVLPITRLLAVAALALLGLLAAHVSAVVLGALGDAVVIVLVVADRLAGAGPPSGVTSSVVQEG